MLRTDSRECFSPLQRKTLVALAETVMPAGTLLPVASADCVAGVEKFFCSQHPAVAAGYRALIHSLNAASLATTLRPFARLDVAKRTKMLNGWRSSGYLRRSALRALITPLKLSHFDNPEFFQQIGCVYEHETGKAQRPRYMDDRVMNAGDFDGDEDIECDVVVIGTGAGGAVVAKELAERGHAVVLLEEGAYFTREEFNGRGLALQSKLYQGAGTIFAVGNTGIPIPTGKTVGGTTTINSGTCYRVPDRVLRKWRDEFGLRDFTPQHMAPYFDRVERIIEVQPAAAKHLGGAARVIARGCDALGYRHKPLLRNAPACDGQGVCCFGCPSDAKRSTNVSYVPLALLAGAHLFTGARVQNILVQRGRAVGVVAQAVGGRKANITVRAKKTVIAGGAFGTPMLLLRNKLCNGSGQLGKNLSIHPAVPVFAEFDEVIAGQNAIPQGYSIEEFHDEGLLFEGATTPLDFSAATISMFGQNFVNLMENFQHVAAFGFMIEDTSRGRVRPTRTGRPLITYVLNKHDVAHIKRGIEILSRVFFAAGAKRVFPLVHGFDELRNESDLDAFRNKRLSARDFDLSAYHPLGTARMGADPNTSVVDSHNQSHDTKDLYITDGAAVPSSLAVNPQVTIMALATRAAEHIDASL